MIDTNKSDREAIGILEAKHQVLYAFYCALFNFFIPTIFSTLFFDLILTLKNIKTRKEGIFRLFGSSYKLYLNFYLNTNLGFFKVLKEIDVIKKII